MRILQPVNLCKTKFSPKWNLFFYLMSLIQIKSVCKIIVGK